MSVGRALAAPDFATGRGAGVARTLGVGEAGGSNPLVPTNKRLTDLIGLPANRGPGSVTYHALAVHIIRAAWASLGLKTDLEMSCQAGNSERPDRLIGRATDLEKHESEANLRKLSTGIRPAERSGLPK